MNELSTMIKSATQKPQPMMLAEHLQKVKETAKAESKLQQTQMDKAFEFAKISARGFRKSEELSHA